MSYRIGDFQIPVEAAFALLVLLGIMLFFLRLRTLLFLTIAILLVTALRVPYHGLARLLRWPFMVSLLGKGVLAGGSPRLFPERLTGTHLSVLLISALLAMSLLYSIGPEVTLAQGGMMLVLWGAVFTALWNSWREEQDLLDLCQSLYQITSVLFLVEITYMVFGLGKTTGASRYTGVFINPNGLGTAVAFLSPFVYWKYRTTDHQIVKAWTVLLGCAMATSLYLSGSRSGLLGTIVCMGAVLAYVHRFRFALLVVISAVPIFIFAYLGPGLDTEAIEAIEESHIVRAEALMDIGGRLERWETAYNLFQDRPWFGYGYAMSKFADIGRADLELASATFHLRGANYHSAHVTMGLDLGIAGLALFWWFLLSVVRRGVLIYLNPTDRDIGLAGMAFYGAFLAFLGDTFVHGWAFSPGSSVAIVFWLVSAAVVRAQMFVGTEPEPVTEAEAPLPHTGDPLAARV